MEVDDVVRGKLSKNIAAIFRPIDSKRFEPVIGGRHPSTKFTPYLLPPKTALNSPQEAIGRLEPDHQLIFCPGFAHEHGRVYTCLEQS